ncbi:4-(cytidine 5'-diphospho)-2-C-methyl-D-erythritol kinase [Athalassotoga sp.]|uniref:4-(cytidine 5'-diphospho)-2-C-methyl-D-erythritol kinase n=1 Tax=Athalassotoga sp. TaxID=2022597 RepID=UPI003D001AC6
MIIKAYAKVNLYLSVLSKRDDGFHDIISLMHNISLYDLLEVEKSDETTFSSKMNLPWDSSNTLFKTMDIFERITGIHPKLKIKLEKHIPSPSGLGGGSADAAALLWYLCENEKISDIMEMARLIGSDVPFFVEGGCAVVEGVGEKIHKLDPLDLGIDLYIPQVGFPTKQMYALVDEMNLCGKSGDPYELYAGIKTGDRKKVSSNLYNTFQVMAEQIHPEITSQAKAHLKDKEFILMTGSGSAFFGFDLHKTKGDVHFTARPRLILD